MPLTLLAGLVTVLVSLSAARPVHGEIFSYIDERGRRVYINTEESSSAVRAKSSAAMAHMIRRRRALLPDIDQHIAGVAARHRVDPKLVHAIIEVESSWDAWAVSHKGAVGLMQLLPETGRRFGVRDLLDPKQNISAGVSYLRFLLNRFNNNLQLTLAAYNAGENVVAERGSVPPYPETRHYVGRVSTAYAHGGSQRSFTSGATPSRAVIGRIYQELDSYGRVVFTNF